MSNEKRKVATDALETLGSIIDENCKRDAIHLAVEPCIAGSDLIPGQHVGIENGVAITSATKKLGIVDPFVTGFVPIGSRFWLIVYPRQITSLRHVWSHPDFADTGAAEIITNVDTIEVVVSKKWIENFADMIEQHPKALMDAADNWVDYEDYTYDNSEKYKGHWDKFPEFWVHYEVVTGRKPASAESFFTCSC